MRRCCISDCYWAIFGLVLVRRPNDWTELNLPDANPDDGSPRGHFQTVLKQSKLILCAITLHW
jgi:hypothetical protein